MEVGSGRAPRRSHEAQPVAPAYLLAFLDENRVQVPVDGRVAGAVRDGDRLAVVAVPAALDDDARAGREDRLVSPRRDIEPLVEGALAREGVLARAETGIQKAAHRRDGRRRGGDCRAAGELRLERG